MNSVYTMKRAPATVTVAASVLMFSYLAVGMLQAQHDAGDRVSSTLKVGRYAEAGESPTIGVNVFESSQAEVRNAFEAASEAFSSSMLDGVQSLGSEFAAVIEDNFWDLVLR
jgi:hypothetical protein